MKYHAEVRKIQRIGGRSEEEKKRITGRRKGEITFAELDACRGKVKDLEIDYGGDVEKEIAALKEVRAIFFNRLSSCNSPYHLQCRGIWKVSN